MRIYSYNQEIKLLTAQFMDSLNDVIVKRTNPNAVKSIKVVAKLGESSRTYKFLKQPNLTAIVPPIICLHLTGITRDPERVSGLNDWMMDVPDPRILTDEQWQIYVNKLPGNPVDLKFEVESFSTTREELDQIICNICAFCNPSYYIVMPHPKIKPRTLTNGAIYQVPLKLQVIWEGNFDLRFPYEAEANDHPFRNYATTTFVVKGWIFPGDKPWDGIQYGEIKKINFFPEIYNEKAADDLWTLSNWYPVPTNMQFSNFQQNILLGKIQRPFYDELAISGKQFLSGAPTGYFSNVSAMISGDICCSSISSISGDPVYLITENEDLLLFSTAQVLNDYMEKVDVPEIIRQYETSGIVK
jgi:hypothetical protein